MPFIIEYCSWESYDTETEEEAIAMFKKQYGEGAEIIQVVR